MWDITLQRSRESNIFFHNYDDIGFDFLERHKDEIGDISKITEIQNKTFIKLDEYEFSLSFAEAKKYSCFKNKFRVLVYIKEIMSCDYFYEYKFSLNNDDTFLRIDYILNEDKFQKYILDNFMKKYEIDETINTENCPVIA